MGTSTSSLQNLKQNPYLVKFVSKTHVSSDDNQFWNELLSFAFSNAIKSVETCKAIEDAASPLLEQFLQNNGISHNLGSLVKVYADRASQLQTLTPEDDRYNLVLVQTLNILYILRCCLKRLVQTLTEDNVTEQFVGHGEDPAAPEPGLVVIEQLVNSLIETIVDVPLISMTYVLHAETITTLLVLLSVQMYSARPAQKSFIYKMIMQTKCAIHAPKLTKCLLSNFVKQEPPPPGAGGSIIIGLASGLWNVLTLGYSKSEEEPGANAILARLSLLLLLVLTNHCTTETNPYREALFTCCDAQAANISGDSAGAGFKIDFAKLFNTLCETQNDDQTTLLLYLLLHQNPAFKIFVLSRTTELDKLTIPILKILYNCSDRSSHHVYMALIILLILTEDNLFNEAVHDISMKNVTWYLDRVQHDISLGGLIVLVVIRAIQYNIARTRDKFLHTNLLATLANMSSHFKQLNTYVCQKLTTLFKKLSKKFNRTLSQVNQTHNGNGLDQSDARSDADTDIISMTGSPDLAHDLSIYEEVLRMILEIVNSCLAAQLTHNPNLVYTLLYNRDIFEPFQVHPSFQDIVVNIETVLTYFSNRIDIEGKDRSLTVPEVYQIIQQSSLQWPSEKLKKFPELKFRYVEDDQPEEFFIPYIWSLVYRSSSIYFNAQNILLFNPHKNVV